MTIYYHYTTPHGLQGIINSKEIWASDYRFLNDATEFQHGLTVFDRVFSSERKRWTIKAPSVSELIERLRGRTDNTSVFIASFTPNGDLLSQWRGYTDGFGFAIGIDADWLIQNASEQGFRQFPVVYDADEHVRVIQDKFQLLDDMLSAREPSEPAQDIIHTWWSQLLVALTTIKNRHFKEEEEVRLVCVTRGRPLKAKIRATNKGLVPYLPIRLDKKIVESPANNDLQNIGLQRIILGPSLHPRQRLAVEALLQVENMRAEVIESEIPYIAD